MVDRPLRHINQPKAVLLKPLQPLNFPPSQLILPHVVQGKHQATEEIVMREGVRVEEPLRTGPGIRRRLSNKYDPQGVRPKIASQLFIPGRLILLGSRRRRHPAAFPRHRRTVKVSPSSIKSGSVPLCSRIDRTILRGIPMPMCSRYR